RLAAAALAAVNGVFQFTPLRGGRPLPSTVCPAGQVFQFTPPRGGRPNCVRSADNGPLFQFTPPRGGRQQIYIKVCVCICAKWEVKGWGSIFCRQVNRFSCNCCIIYCVPCKKCNHFSAPTHRKIMWEGGRRKAAYNNRGSPV